MQSRNGHLLLSPSDLNDYVECEHRTTLARQVALGQRAKPHASDEGAKLLADKGMQHEADLLMRMHAEGRHVVEVPMENWDFDAAAARTIDAMRLGADVIFQATFVDGPWRGRADFLLKVKGDSRLGPWRYEALDAKLARAEKPTYVLQLCFYSDGIAAIQGHGDAPDWIACAAPIAKATTPAPITAHSVIAVHIGQAGAAPASDLRKRLSSPTVANVCPNRLDRLCRIMLTTRFSQVASKRIP